MNLNWISKGNGKPFVFLHAFPLSAGMWEGIISTVTGSGYKFLAPDFPGFGDSNGVISSLKDVADQIIEDLKDQDILEADFCGMSMGGYVLMELRTTFPDFVSHSVYCDTSPRADDAAKIEARMNAIRRIASGQKDEYIDDLIAALVSNSCDSKRRSEIRSSMLEANAEAMIEAQRAMVERGSYEELFQSSGRGDFLIFGEDDPSCADLPAFGEMPSERTFVIPDCGHFSALEKPEEFRTSLSRILSELSK